MFNIKVLTIPYEDDGLELPRYIVVQRKFFHPWWGWGIVRGIDDV